MWSVCVCVYVCDHRMVQYLMCRVQNNQAEAASTLILLNPEAIFSLQHFHVYHICLLLRFRLCVCERGGFV